MSIGIRAGEERNGVEVFRRGGDKGIILREGLRLLKQRDEVWKAEVRDRIKQGMDSIRGGRTIPVEQVQAEMRTFKKKWKKNRSAATAFAHKDIAFALSFSNSSNASTHRSLPVYFNPTALTPNSKHTSEPNWIASIKR
jgi:hypothetical protein